MPLTHQQLTAAIDKIKSIIDKADEEVGPHFDEDEYAQGSAEWYVELCYMSLKVLCEAFSLPNIRKEISEAYDAANKVGLTQTLLGPENDRYLAALGPCRRITAAIENVFATDSDKTITKDLIAILKGMTYAITNARAFGNSPANEADVHDRIEAVLRCVFPDLIHKPSLTKPIKNFQPDTGLPSLKTLLEYKFISNAIQVPTIADEILADTRGYHSKDWDSFVFVIYETQRFREEAEWRQLLAATGVSENATLLVLTGNDINVRSNTRTGRRITRKSVEKEKWR